MDYESELENDIALVQKELNKPDNVPAKAYRRDVSVYELVSYVNNITGCYFSENYKPIPLFIERGRVYMDENYKEGVAGYFKLVEEYFSLLEKHGDSLNEQP